MIKAVGVKNKKKISLECSRRDDGKVVYRFDGERDYSLESDIEILLLHPVPIMGTYWPECDALKIAAVLPYFFDRGGVDRIEVDDPEARKELADLGMDEKAVY